MSDFAEDKVKIRFKFRSGDEFEAEGSPEFIEKQRSDFLQLISQERGSTRNSRRNTILVPATDIEDISTPPETSAPTVMNGSVNTLSALPDLNGNEPALYRRPTAQQATPLTDIQQPTGRRFSAEKHLTDGQALPTISQGISAAERAALRRLSSTDGEEREMTPDIRLWEEIVRVEDQMVFLRRKNRLLTPETAAVVLLAAARILLRQPDGYSALALSKSLKKSGYGGERLDRVLGGELKLGTVRSIGSKRSRLYFLSDEGFAKAYVLAEKLADPQP